MPPFRQHNPVRTCDRLYARYTSYKLHLRNDFNKRCGYCNDLDSFCGGTRGFHIDHFCPQDKFSHLETNYGNLVYACPYCNGAKSNDWPASSETPSIVDGKGYVDPCDVDFTNHFERFPNGRIMPRLMWAVVEALEPCRLMSLMELLQK